MLSERTTFAGNLGDHRAGKCLVVALSLLAACEGPKERIVRSFEESRDAAVEIQAEARAGDAELATVETLAIPDEARPPVKSARQRFDRIGDQAQNVQGSAADGLQASEHVKPIGMGWLKRLAYSALALVLALGLAYVLLPSFARWVALRIASAFGRATMSAAKLAREAVKEPDPVKAQEKLRQAVAAQRAGSRTYDAAWREAERKAVEQELRELNAGDSPPMVVESGGSHA